MLSSLVISFREALEAALVVTAILSMLAQHNLKDLFKYVFAGSIGGFLVSGAAGAFLFNQLQHFTGPARDFFEAGIGFFVSALIAYFIVWAGSKKAPKSVDAGFTEADFSAASLVSITFFTVLKEGLEVIIFTITNLSQGVVSIVSGSTIGLVLAILATVIIYKTAAKLNVDLIFQGITLILIFIGAEMFGESVPVLLQMPVETVETPAYLLFLIPSLYFFLKGRLKTYLKKYKK